MGAGSVDVGDLVGGIGVGDLVGGIGVGLAAKFEAALLAAQAYPISATEAPWPEE